MLIKGPELVGSLGENPGWEEIQASLPEARGRYQVLQDEWGEVISNWRREDGPVPDFDKYILAECSGVLLTFQRDGERWRGDEVLSGCAGSLSLSTAPPGVAGVPHIERENGRILAIRPVTSLQEFPVLPELWEDWTYTSTLLTLDRPLYVGADPFAVEDFSSEEGERRERIRNERRKELETSLQRGRDEGLVAIRSALDVLSPTDRLLGTAADFAEAKGALDLALDVRSRYRPFGTCSMDTTPQDAARSYSELCYRKGDLACFLNLQLRIMGANFSRIAYSSYGEAAQGTEVDRLQAIGIDVERFLRGLVVHYDVEGHDRIEIGPWRLARSIYESEVGGSLEAFLRDLATNPAADPYNRLRSTVIWGYYLVQQNRALQPDAALSGWEPVLAKLRDADLSAEGGSWLEQIEAQLREN